MDFEQALAWRGVGEQRNHVLIRVMTNDANPPNNQAFYEDRSATVSRT